MTRSVALAMADFLNRACVKPHDTHGTHSLLLEAVTPQFDGAGWAWRVEWSENVQPHAAWYVRGYFRQQRVA